MNQLTTRRGLLIALGTLIALGFSWSGIVLNERLITSGDPLYLELRPVDPRSLVQGDYMALDWTVAAEARQEANEARQRGEPWPRRGALLLAVDERNVGHFAGRHLDGEPVLPGHRLLQYRMDGGGVDVASDAWFFQEGQAEVFEDAQYGLLHVNQAGRDVLVRMVDEDFEPLGEPLERW